jgi:hypothetical protein
MSLLNATPFDAAYLDGTTERILVRRLTIRQLYTFTQLLAGEKVPELVILCTGRSPEWIDTLADESMGALAQLCIQLNFPRAVTLSKTDPVIAQRVVPFLQGMQTLAILTGTAGLFLNPNSPAPASSASAEATGSDASTSPPSDSAPSSPPPTG